MKINPHKRFLVFAIERYSEQGGLGDLAKSFDTKEEAVKFCEKFKEDLNYKISVYDRIKGVEVE